MQATSIAVGIMVGASVFSVFGLGARIAGYLFVLASHLRLAPKYGGNRPFLVLAFLVVAAVFVVLLSYQWRTNRAAFHATWAVLLGSVVLEVVYRAVTRRRLIPRSVPKEPERAPSFPEHPPVG